MYNFYLIFVYIFPYKVLNNKIAEIHWIGEELIAKVRKDPFFQKIKNTKEYKIISYILYIKLFEWLLKSVKRVYQEELMNDNGYVNCCDVILIAYYVFN